MYIVSNKTATQFLIETPSINASLSGCWTSDSNQATRMTEEDARNEAEFQSNIYGEIIIIGNM